jgi:hypothetical protein
MALGNPRGMLMQISPQSSLVRSGVLMRPSGSLDNGSLAGDLALTVVDLPLHLSERVLEVFSNGLDIGHACTLAVRTAAQQRRLADSPWGGTG